MKTKTNAMNTESENTYIKHLLPQLPTNAGIYQFKNDNGKMKKKKKVGNIPVTIIVRLQGTNAEEGAKIIQESGLKVFSAILLKDAAQKIKEVLA